MTHTLEQPATDDDWRAFHDIREAELWTARGRAGYNRRHEHDYDVQANQPLLLKFDGRPIGTLRLDDLGNGTGCIRLVAIVRNEQGRGHGRVMSELWEARARERGLRTLYVNAAQQAVGYYEVLGWEHHVWDEGELTGIAADCVQMRKRL